MPRIEQYRERFKCSFEQAQAIFEPCLRNALDRMSPQAVDDFLHGASLLCMMGRGMEPVLIYLEEAPSAAPYIGEGLIGELANYAYKLATSTNAQAVVPFLQSILPVAKRLECEDSMRAYLALGLQVMQDTTPSIHGHHAIHPSPALPALFASAPRLLEHLTLGGLKNWAEYGAKAYVNDPERQQAYFALESADSRAIMQRERHGTLLADNERKLGCYLQGLWQEERLLVPYSDAIDAPVRQRPYFDELGIRVPDVFDDLNGVSGLDRYRALLAHMLGHLRWSGKITADNYSPMQRVAMEVFEDSRVEYLAMQRWPGLRRLFQALHPQVAEDDCDPQRESCLNHRLMLLSYALLHPEDHPYRNPLIREFSQRFHDRMAEGETATRDAVELGLAFMARSRVQSDALANVYFSEHEVEFRDDNRHLWQFIEEGDEEELFDTASSRAEDEEERDYALPPRLYPEWDYLGQSYRPEWASVFENLHPAGQAGHIDRLLEKHQGLAKRLRQIVDLLKPQNKMRIRYQEEGAELDLDVAIRSLIDLRSGAQPDPRINMSHRHAERDLSVLLLIDLSASVDEVPEGCTQSILELSQEAVALLAWAIEELGDPFAIAGFDSNTRHEVRYRHLKGFSEHWGPQVKARLAAMEAGMSTRMGAAMRHAGHYLEGRDSDKKLLLILTDGEPADIDVKDERLLIEDARQAFKELDAKGIYTYCINLDARADHYVRDIFGRQYTIIDHIKRLPEQLPRLFMSLTG